MWLKVNQLSLNVKKTSFITFGSYRDSIPASLSLYIYGKEIKRVQICKYLGIYIDCYLRWDYQIKELIKRTKFVLIIFYRLRSMLNGKSLKIIYHALFESVVNYGIIAWGGCNKSIWKPLLNTQKRLIKLFHKNDFQDSPLTITHTFILESILYYYEECKNLFISYTGKSRSRQIILPKI